MGFFPTSPGDGDEIGPNTNGTYFKYVATDNKWIIISNITVSDIAYNEGSWNGNVDAATKNALRDKFESIGAGVVSDTAFGASWDGVTTIAPSKNTIYDAIGGGYIINLPSGCSVSDIQSAINTLTATGGIVQLPEGTIDITSSYIELKDGVTLKGISKDATIIEGDGDGVHNCVMRMNGQNYVRVENLKLQANTCTGIRFDGNNGTFETINCFYYGTGTLRSLLDFTLTAASEIDILKVLYCDFYGGKQHIFMHCGVNNSFINDFVYIHGCRFEFGHERTVYIRAIGFDAKFIASDCEILHNGANAQNYSWYIDNAGSADNSSLNVCNCLFESNGLVRGPYFKADRGIISNIQSRNWAASAYTIVAPIVDGGNSTT